MTPPISIRRPLFGAIAQEVAELSGQEIEQALAEQKCSGGRIGSILLQRRRINREQLRAILSLQARRMVQTLQADQSIGECPFPATLSVCMPAYNEELNIEDTLDGACAVLPELVRQFEVVVVDDGCRDGTAAVVERYMAAEPRVRLVRHEVNRGYGAAVTSGLRAARGDLVFFTDSDGQFSLLDLAQFLHESRRNEVVIGYRHARAENGMRRFNAFAWNTLIRLLLGVRVRDLDCAFKLFRRDVVDQLSLTATGAAISAEIMVQTARGRYRLRQLPVGHYPRCFGAPTGAAIKVIARAFRELPQLWRYRTKPVDRPESPNDRSATRIDGRPVAAKTPHVRSSPRLDLTRVQPDSPPLKVCMLAACPFPANHGTPGSIREMAEAVAERGHQVHLVTYHMGEEIPVVGPQIHRIRPLTDEQSVVVGPTVRRPLYDLQMVFKTIEVVRRHRCDLIHAHGYEAALVAWLARLASGAPVVCSAHNTMSDELPTYQFIRPRWLASALGATLDAFVPRIGDRVIPHSANIERFYQAKGLRARTESVIYKGIKLDDPQVIDTDRVRIEHGLGTGPVVLYAGVMNEFQRLDLLFEAMARVVWYEPAVKLLMVVTIPSERHVSAARECVRRLGLTNNVLFTDPQTLDRLPEYLAACDVAVVPRPQSPGFPIKILNYMAARKPCVLFASSAGGLTHRENAFLVPSDTAEAMAEAILELLRDADLRHEIGRNAFEFVKRNRDRRLTAQEVCAAYRRTIHQPQEPAVAPAELDVPVSVTRTVSQHVAKQDETVAVPVVEAPSEVLCEAAIERTA